MRYINANILFIIVIDKVELQLFTILSILYDILYEKSKWTKYNDLF